MPANRKTAGRKSTTSEGKHVLAMVMQSGVVPPAKPSYLQRLVISIVMGIDRCVAADFAGQLFQFAGFQGALHGKVGIVFGRIGPSPVCLPGIGFEH